MTFKNVVTLVVTSFCALLVCTSCSSTRAYYPTGKRVGHGPPAHAPAHGHRRKQVCGVELVFDTGLGLYVVVGHPNHYYCDGYFYRLTGSVWEMSLRFDGGWAVRAGKPLPPGLRAKSNGNGNGNRNHSVKANGNVQRNPAVKATGNGNGNGNGKAKKQVKTVAKGNGKNKGR